MGTTPQAMRDLVEHLSSPECTPRNPGTDGGVAARNSLRYRLESLGLEPGGEHGFDQPIPPIDGSNLIGIIPGKGDRYVLLAAHYDACGDDNPGADDNAAGVAVALAVAENLHDATLDRSVIIALFDAEEPPYFVTPTMGSQWFVDHPTVPLEKIDMMICLDLVGHALGSEGMPPEVGESIFVLGAEKSTGTTALMHTLPDHPGIRPRMIDNYIIEPMSDYDAFMKANIPFLFYSAGRWEHYHASTDTPEKLDYTKMVAFSHHLTDVVKEMTNRADMPTYVEEGVDDESTVSSLLAILQPLGDVSPTAATAFMIVTGLQEKLETTGPLNTGERGAIATIVNQIEEALS